MDPKSIDAGSGVKSQAVTASGRAATLQLPGACREGNTPTCLPPRHGLSWPRAIHPLGAPLHPGAAPDPRDPITPQAAQVSRGDPGKPRGQTSKQAADSGSEKAANPGT